MAEAVFQPAKASLHGSIKDVISVSNFHAADHGGINVVRSFDALAGFSGELALERISFHLAQRL